MASFDFIEASVRSYEFIWRHKKYLARVAFPVIFVKVACLLAVVTFGAQDMFLRQGLIMLPAYAVEALFMIGLIRYLLFGENIFIWGKSFPAPNPPKPLISDMSSRSRTDCIQAGVAIYLLCSVVHLCFSGLMLDYAQGLDPRAVSDTESPPSLAGGVLVMAIMAAAIWLFRLFWLYIPAAMGVSITGFMRRIAGITSSAYMIGAWLMCFLPPMVILFVGLQMIVSIFPEGTDGFVIASSIFNSVFTVIVASLQIAAMTFGFTEILFGSDKDKK